MARELQLTEYRTFENCLHRLEVRELIASGTGDTDIDALYNFLCSLYIVPVSESLPLRIVAFLKMLFQGVPFSKAKRLFTRVPLSAQEAQILGLSKQALLSTAELIKCVDLGVTDLSTGNKIMDALYIIPPATTLFMPCKAHPTAPRSRWQLPIFCSAGRLSLRGYRQ